MIIFSIKKKRFLKKTVQFKKNHLNLSASIFWGNYEKNSIEKMILFYFWNKLDLKKLTSKFINF